MRLRIGCWLRLFNFFLLPNGGGSRLWHNFFSLGLLFGNFRFCGELLLDWFLLDLLLGASLLGLSDNDLGVGRDLNVKVAVVLVDLELNVELLLHLLEVLKVVLGELDKSVAVSRSYNCGVLNCLLLLGCQLRDRLLGRCRSCDRLVALLGLGRIYFRCWLRIHLLLSKELLLDFFVSLVFEL